MSDGRLPAERPEPGLVFDPRSSSPMLRRGLARIERIIGTVPNDLEPAGPEVLWSAHASSCHPVLGSGAVYVLAVDSLTAHEARTGSVLWRYVPGPEYRGAGTPYLLNSFVLHVADGLIYVEGFDGGGADTFVDLHAVDASTGRVRWVERIGNPIQWRLSHGVVLVEVNAGEADGSLLRGLDGANGRDRFSAGAAGAITGEIDQRNPLDLPSAPGVLFANLLGPPEAMHAIDLVTGESRWRVTPPPESAWPEVRPGLVLVQPARPKDADWRPVGPSVLVALDADTGGERWRSPDDVWVGRVQPAARGNAIYVAAWRPGEEEIVLALDADTGAARWQAEIGHAYELAVVGEAVCALGEGVTALDPNSGAVLWRLDEGGDEEVSVFMPRVLDGTLYHGTGLDGYLVALDPSTGAERWRFDHMDTHATSFHVQAADGVAYVAGGGALHALDAATGRQAWQLAIDQVVAPMAVDIWEIEILCVAEGVVYARFGRGQSAGWPHATAPLGDGILCALRHRPLVAEPPPVGQEPGPRSP